MRKKTRKRNERGKREVETGRREGRILDFKEGKIRKGKRRWKLRKKGK